MAFLTGSQVYGRPREDSDIDLVALVDPLEILLLVDILNEHVITSDPGNERNYHDGALASASIRIGKLNLILFSDHELYEGWYNGTERCFQEQPVDRATAVKIIKAEIARVKGETKLLSEAA